MPLRPNPSADALEAASGILAALDRHLGERTSLRQAMALVSVMRAEQEKRRQSLIDLQVDVGGIPSRSINVLSALKMVTLEKSLHDRRNVLTGLTQEGRSLANEIVSLQRGDTS